MKIILILISLAQPLCAQQALDFKSLDKLESLAKNKTKVTLDADMLKLAANFLGDDKDTAGLKSLVQNLKGIYVRTYEFDKKDQYTMEDVEPLREMLKQRQWSWIVQSQEGKDFSDVYIQPLQNDRFGGVAIISGEARELTVIYINGPMTISDLTKLSGNMGIPHIHLGPAKKLLPKDQPGKQKDEN